MMVSLSSLSVIKLDQVQVRTILQHVQQLQKVGYSVELCLNEITGRHSRILMKFFSVYSPIEPSGTKYLPVMLPATKIKLAMGFVHTLINVEILVLSRLSEFCVIL